MESELGAGRAGPAGPPSAERVAWRRGEAWAGRLPGGWCTPGVGVRSAGPVTASPAPLPGRVSRESWKRKERLERSGRRRPRLLRRRRGRRAAGSAGENGKWPAASLSARPLLRTRGRGWGARGSEGRGAPGSKVTGAAGRGPPSCAGGAAGVGGARRWEPQDLGRALRGDLSAVMWLDGMEALGQRGGSDRCSPMHEPPGDRGAGTFVPTQHPLGGEMGTTVPLSGAGNSVVAGPWRSGSTMAGLHPQGLFSDAECRVYQEITGALGGVFKKWGRV